MHFIHFITLIAIICYNIRVPVCARVHDKLSPIIKKMIVHRKMVILWSVYVFCFRYVIEWRRAFMELSEGRFVVSEITVIFIIARLCHSRGI